MNPYVASTDAALYEAIKANYQGYYNQGGYGSNGYGGGYGNGYNQGYDANQGGYGNGYGGGYGNGGGFR